MTVYSDGTITLEQGSAEVIGDGTAWETSLIVGGVIYVEAEGGNALPILSVDSDTQITAAIKWMGESGEYSYSIVRDTSSGQQTIRNSEALAQILQGLSSPAVGAMAGVTPAAQKLMLFTGATTATTIDLADLIKGVEFNQQVADMDELAEITDVEIGYRVLVLDAEDGRSALFTRIEVANERFWSNPAFITGPVGEVGPYRQFTIGDIVTLDPHEAAAVTLTEVDGETLQLNFSLPKGADGVDGDGAGDVLGPASAIVGHAAVFDNVNGKRISSAGFALGGAASKNVGSVSGTVAAGDDPRFDAAGKNDAVFALEIADLRGSRLGMVGGVADAFDGETGVDLTASENFVYRSASHSYLPVQSGGTTTINTFSANATSGNGYTIINREKALLHGSDVASIGVYSASAIAFHYKIARRNSAGSYDIIQSHSVSHPGGGWYDFTLPTPYTVPASGTYYLGSYRASGSTSQSASTLTAISSTNVNSTGNGVSLTEGTTVAYPTRCTYVDKYLDMTLQSVTYLASADPKVARIVVQVEHSSPIVINDDVSASISRDGGETWETASLDHLLSSGSMSLYGDDNIDLSGLDAGSEIVWRIQTNNETSAAISGVVAQWK